MYNVLSLSLSLGFHNGNAIERIHKQFCKRLLGVKNVPKNDMILIYTLRYNVLFLFC